MKTVNSSVALRDNVGGFSLIEMLVSMVIGLFLLLGLSTYFVQNKETFAYQKSQVNQQEHERIISSALGRTLRQAGYAPVDTNRLTGQEVVFDAVGTTYESGQFVRGTQGTANVTVNGVVAAQAYPNDTVMVRYLGDANIFRCDGTNPVAGALVEDAFSVDGIQFICTTDGVTATPLFGNVNVALPQQLRVLGMAVTYGMDLDDDGNVDRVARAGGVTDWTRVRIVELEVHFQAGSRQPQANSIVIALENSIGVDQI